MKKISTDFNHFDTEELESAACLLAIHMAQHLITVSKERLEILRAMLVELQVYQTREQARYADKCEKVEVLMFRNSVAATGPELRGRLDMVKRIWDENPLKPLFNRLDDINGALLLVEKGLEHPEAEDVSELSNLLSIRRELITDDVVEYIKDMIYLDAENN